MSIQIAEAPRRFSGIIRLELYRGGKLIDQRIGPNSRVNVGAQAMVNQMFGTSAAAAQFNYVALSTSTTAPALTDTATTFTAGGEITTGGLARKQATYTYVTAPLTLNATAAITLYAAWTASAGGTIGSVAALNASSGGILGLETLVPGGAMAYNNTDSVVLNWALAQ